MDAPLNPGALPWAHPGSRGASIAQMAAALGRQPEPGPHPTSAQRVLLPEPRPHSREQSSSTYQQSPANNSNPPRPKSNPSRPACLLPQSQPTHPFFPKGSAQDPTPDNPLNYLTQSFLDHSIPLPELLASTELVQSLAPPRALLLRPPASDGLSPAHMERARDGAMGGLPGMVFSAPIPFQGPHTGV